MSVANAKQQHVLMVDSHVKAKSRVWVRTASTAWLMIEYHSRSQSQSGENTLVLSLWRRVPHGSPCSPGIASAWIARGPTVPVYWSGVAAVSTIIDSDHDNAI